MGVQLVAGDRGTERDRQTEMAYRVIRQRKEARRNTKLDEIFQVKQQV